MDLGAHLPLMQFGDEGLSLGRLEQAADAARECGFAAVSANDHFVFSTPWLDGPTAIASVIERTADMALATTISLAVLRGPVPLAKTLAALDVLSEGRLIAGIGPGSSRRDYDALGVPFDERWKRFDEAIAVLRALLEGKPRPEDTHYFSVPSDVELAPAPRHGRGIPLWIGSWGSKAGLRRVARAGDGWLASAYNTTPEAFAEARGRLAHELEDRGRDAQSFPNALATMWTWVTKDRAEGDRVLEDVLSPILNRDRDELRDQLCVGPAEHCAALLSRYAEAGCQRVYLWPLGDERRQIELVASEVVPRIEPDAALRTRDIPWGMSQNVEVVRSTLDAFNREGVEAALAYFDPEVEWLGPPEWLEKPLYKGHEGIREIASVWGENFHEYRLDLEKAIDAGDDHVVALVYQRGRIKSGGAPIEGRIGYDWEVRRGKGVRVQVYFSWEEALRAAGLE